MPEFYAGQTDYIDKLNTLATANELAGIQVGQAALDAAVADAEAAATSATGSAGTATTKASEASGYATTASGAATTAQAWATQLVTPVSGGDYSAKYNANLAATSASAASGSATTAQAWATQLSTPVSGGDYSAKYNANLAAASASAASGSASTASTSATTAQAWATQLVTPVSGSDYSAKYNANLAAASAGTATTKAGEASASATAAEGYATTASQAITTSQAWATQLVTPVSGGDYSAKYNANLAAASAGTASTKAAEALASADTAATHAGTATTKAGEALTSAGTASTKAGEAATSASNANTYAGNASTSATLAQAWATQLVTPVSGGEYSAKYWAQQAAASVTGQLVYRGAWSAATGSYPTTPALGDYYKVTVAGTVSSVSYDIGDHIIYNGTTWDKVDNTETAANTTVTLTGEISGSGQTGTNIPTTLGTVLDVDFNTAGTTSAVARLKWNDGSGTLDLGLKGGNVVLQLGQEQVQYVNNNTGSTLVDGQVVYITGSQGQRPTVALASNASEATSSKTMGVVTETILNGADGFVTISGLVNNINTSSFSQGAGVWLGTAGTLTATKPTAPNHAVFVGWIVRSHASSGSLLVHIQNGYELDELHDVLISGATNGHVLKYDGTKWVNTTLAKADVGLANVDNTSDANKPVSSATQTALNAKEGTIAAGTTSQYYRGDKSWQTLDKTAVGLTNVDNTSDANKPISSATQTALNAKQATLVSGVNIKTVNGVALTGSGDITIVSAPGYEQTFLMMGA